MIWSILHSRLMTLILGIALVAYATYDIYEELFMPSHEHILIIIGLLLIISAVGHANEGLYKIAQTASPDKEFHFLGRISLFFERPLVAFTLGLTVLIVSVYGLYEDFEKIHSKTVSIGVGVFIILISLTKTYMGGKKVLGAIKESSDDMEHTSSI